MDNENKIVNSREIFLSNDSLPVENRPTTYNVAKEFSKTKKNKNHLVLLVSLLFAILISGAIVGISMFISRESRNVQVDIRNFEDMNLRDLLDQVKKNQNDLERSLRQLKDLELQYSDARAALDGNLDKDLHLLDNKNQATAAFNREKQLILETHESAVSELDIRFGSLIDEKKEEVAAIQDRITAYDQRLSEQNKEQQELLDAKAKVFELEKQQLTDYYEERVSALTKEKEDGLAESKGYYENLINLLKSNQRKAVSLLNRQYKKQISDIREAAAFEVAELNRTMEEERDALLKEQDELIQRILGIHEAEQTALVQRYNPPEAPWDVEEVSERRKSTTRFTDSLEIPDSLGVELSLSGVATEIKSISADESVLIDYLTSLPYRDSARRGLDTLELLSYRQQNEWNNFLGTADRQFKVKNDIISQQNEALDQLVFAMSSRMQQNRENGFVIDPRNNEKIALIVDNLFNIKEGDTALIFRRDDEYIGRLELYFSRERLYGRLSEGEKEILPFDKLLIEIKKENE